MADVTGGLQALGGLASAPVRRHKRLAGWRALRLRPARSRPTSPRSASTRRPACRSTATATRATQSHTPRSAGRWPRTRCRSRRTRSDGRRAWADRAGAAHRQHERARPGRAADGRERQGPAIRPRRMPGAGGGFTTRVPGALAPPTPMGLTGALGSSMRAQRMRPPGRMPRVAGGLEWLLTTTTPT